MVELIPKLTLKISNPLEFSAHRAENSENLSPGNSSEFLGGDFQRV